MTRFNISEYHQAREFAQQQADNTKLDMVIRKVREFGIPGFNVSFACKNDSDYSLGEIVSPNS